MTPNKPAHEPAPPETIDADPIFDDPRIVEPPIYPCMDPRMDMSNDGDHDEPWDMPVEPPGL